MPIILFCVINQSHHETPIAAIAGFEQYFKFFSMYKMKYQKSYM